MKKSFRAHTHEMFTRFLEVPGNESALFKCDLSMKATKPLMAPFIETAIAALQTEEMRESIRKTFVKQGQLGVCRTEYRVGVARERREAQRLTADLAAVDITRPHEPMELDAIPIDITAPVIPRRPNGSARAIPAALTPPTAKKVTVKAASRAPVDVRAPVIPAGNFFERNPTVHERPVINDMDYDQDVDKDEPLMDPIVRDEDYYNYENLDEDEELTGYDYDLFEDDEPPLMLKLKVNKRTIKKQKIQK